MQWLIAYNIKVAALLVVLYALFRLLLARRNSHRVNRATIMLSALLAFVLPLCVVTIHQTAPAANAPQALAANADAALAMSAGVAPMFWNQKWMLTVLTVVYLAGVAFCLSLTAVKLHRLRRFIAGAERRSMGDGITLAIVDAPVAPFSWMKTIVISRHDYDLRREELLAHERAHIRLRHSCDVVAMELLSAMQWFNPAIWMMRADLRSIHEYEADQAVIRGGTDVRRYVSLLIEKAQEDRVCAIANSISDSTLRQRVVMMIKTDCPRCGWLRALYILPVAAVSLTLSAKTVVDAPSMKHAEKEVAAAHAPRVSASSDAAALTPARTGNAPAAFSPKQNDTPKAKTGEKAAQGKTEASLIFVDGKEVSSFDGLDPQEIASVNVLPGSLFTQIYGEKYAGRKVGKIIYVTTRQGSGETSARQDAPIVKSDTLKAQTERGESNAETYAHAD